MDDNAEGERRIGHLLHELRQPLNTIVLACTNMQNRVRLGNSKLSEDYLIQKTDGILNSISQSARLIDEIEKIYKKLWFLCKFFCHWTPQCTE